MEIHRAREEQRCYHVRRTEHEYNTEEAPFVGTKESENDKDATMNDVEEYKDTKETHGEGKLNSGNNKDKVDKLMPATLTNRMSALKKILKFTGEGKLYTPFLKG